MLVGSAGSLDHATAISTVFVLLHISGSMRTLCLTSSVQKRGASAVPIKMAESMNKPHAKVGPPVEPAEGNSPPLGGAHPPTRGGTDHGLSIAEFLELHGSNYLPFYHRFLPSGVAFRPPQATAPNSRSQHFAGKFSAVLRIQRPSLCGTGILLPELG